MSVTSRTKFQLFTVIAFVHHQQAHVYLRAGVWLLRHLLSYHLDALRAHTLLFLLLI